jgi:hypothetical protein
VHEESMQYKCQAIEGDQQTDLLIVHAMRQVIIIHLLGLAPAGYLAAPNSGPEGH